MAAGFFWTLRHLADMHLLLLNNKCPCSSTFSAVPSYTHVRKESYIIFMITAAYASIGVVLGIHSCAFHTSSHLI